MPELGMFKEIWFLQVARCPKQGDIFEDLGPQISSLLERSSLKIAEELQEKSDTQTASDQGGTCPQIGKVPTAMGRTLLPAYTG